MLKSPIIYYCSGKSRSLSRCHTNNMNITLTAYHRVSSYSSAFSDWHSCATTEAPPTVFTSAAVHRLLQTAGFRFHHLHGFQPLKFRFRCEEVEGIMKTPHNWVFLGTFTNLIFPENWPKQYTGFKGEVVFSVAMKCKCPNSNSRSSHQILWNP